MKSNRAVKFRCGALGVAVVLAAGYAGARWIDRSERFRAQRAAREQLLEAHRLAKKHPEAFGTSGQTGTERPLKGIVQEAGAKEGVAIAFLSEAEKDAGKGRKERQVSARVVRAEHAKLVGFLGALEANAKGARVKEIRLRPSKDATGVYEEAEIVLARGYAVEAKKP